jgi:hypothetical protein
MRCQSLRSVSLVPSPTESGGCFAISKAQAKRIRQRSGPLHWERAFPASRFKLRRQRNLSLAVLRDSSPFLNLSINAADLRPRIPECKATRDGIAKCVCNVSKWYDTYWTSALESSRLRSYPPYPMAIASGRRLPNSSPLKKLITTWWRVTI